MKDDYTTNSHYLTYTFLLRKVRRIYFLNLRVKGLRCNLLNSPKEFCWIRIEHYCLVSSDFKSVNSPVVFHASLIESIPGRQTSPTSIRNIRIPWTTLCLTLRARVVLVTALVRSAPVPIPPIRCAASPHPQTSADSRRLCLVAWWGAIGTETGFVDEPRERVVHWSAQRVIRSVDWKQKR